MPWSNNVRAFTAQKNYVMLTVDGPDVRAVVYSDTGQVLDDVDLYAFE